MIKRQVYIDFSKKNGRIRPVNSVNTGPRFGLDLGLDFSEEYRQMAVPFVRTHNVEPPYGGGRFVDVHNIFPDFSLDERFDQSYNFAPTDEYFASVKAGGCDIFLRLGESSDGYEIRPYIGRPDDILKWARVCEHIIAHYNMGWACGFKYGIKFVEIFSDADEKCGWKGERVEFFEFYRIVASYLKMKFPKLKIGAYSGGGFYSLNHFDASADQKVYVSFLEEFLDYVTSKQTKAPLDFLSWKCYADTPEEIALHSNYARNYLDHSGLKKTLSIISEFNLRDRHGADLYFTKEYLANFVISLIVAQKSSVDMMFLSSADPRADSCPLYSLEDRKNKKYYAPYRAMVYFGSLARKGVCVDISEDFRREIYSLATYAAGEGAVLLVTKNYNGIIELNFRGADVSSYSIKGLLGGGERGSGYLTEAENLSCKGGKVLLRAGQNEVYLITVR